MKLPDYLIERDGISRRGNVLLAGPELARIAVAIRLSARHLYQIALGSKRASWRTALRIEKHTGGIVTAAEVMPAHTAKGRKVMK